MAIQPSRFEPQQFAAGDTISFLKALADYPATAGWGLQYELAGDNSYQFASVATGDSHQVTVAAAATADFAPGDYELTGWAVNAGTAERVQIYQALCVVGPNLGAGPVRTHAQKMLAFVEAVQLGKATHDILESDVEGTRIKRMSPAELRTEYGYWKQLVENERDGDRARSGLPSRNKIKTRFQITQVGPPVGLGNPFRNP